MSHNKCINNNATTYLDDSEEESLFYVPKQAAKPLPFNKHPISKRIIQTPPFWQQTEKQAYVSFLKDNFDLMDRPIQQRKNRNAYWLMAASIKSKNYAQCRIHHSRLLRRHGSVESIIGACDKELKRGEGSCEKMQQYGLRVEVEEEQESECCIEESELWTVIETCQRIYYQNQCTLPSAYSL